MPGPGENERSAMGLQGVRAHYRICRAFRLLMLICVVRGTTEQLRALRLSLFQDNAARGQRNHGEVPEST